MRARVQTTTRRGRPYPTTTNLGKLMAHINMPMHQLASESGVYIRTLSEILAGRQLPTVTQRSALAAALEVDPKLLGPTRES